MEVDGFLLQDAPRMYVAAISGPWLLERTTPSWRLKNPQTGFQRIVKEDRARQVASAVLDQKRTFPSAIVLATDVNSFGADRGTIRIPDTIRFLIVDGQHRLWAQMYSDYSATYACIIHAGLTEVDMARLFIEINDNQKRVPSSLRWDLVRLVRPEEREFDVIAAELVYALANERRSPLFQRIDLTGEQKELRLKQGSIAPEIKSLVSKKDSPLRGIAFDTQLDILVDYLAALRSLDPAGWKEATTPLLNLRVLRALLQLLPEVLEASKASESEVTAASFRTVLTPLHLASLSTEHIRAVQGSAGIRAIREEIRGQLSL